MKAQLKTIKTAIIVAILLVIAFVIFVGPIGRLLKEFFIIAGPEECPPRGELADSIDLLLKEEKVDLTAIKTKFAAYKRCYAEPLPLKQDIFFKLCKLFYDGFAWNETITACNDFIKAFPKSKKIQNISKFVTDALICTEPQKAREEKILKDFFKDVEQCKCSQAEKLAQQIAWSPIARDFLNIAILECWFRSGWEGVYSGSYKDKVDYYLEPFLKKIKINSSITEKEVEIYGIETGLQKPYLYPAYWQSQCAFIEQLAAPESIPLRIHLFFVRDENPLSIPKRFPLFSFTNFDYLGGISPQTLGKEKWQNYTIILKYNDITEKMLQTYPDIPVALHLHSILAYIARMLNDHATAVSHYQKIALANSPCLDQDIATLLKGDVYFRTKNFSAAIRAYDNVRKLKDYALLAKGVSYLNMHNFKNATDAFADLVSFCEQRRCLPNHGITPRELHAISNRLFNLAQDTANASFWPDADIKKLLIEPIEKLKDDVMPKKRTWRVRFDIWLDADLEHALPYFTYRPFESALFFILDAKDILDNYKSQYAGEACIPTEQAEHSFLKEYFVSPDAAKERFRNLALKCIEQLSKEECEQLGCEWKG